MQRTPTLAGLTLTLALAACDSKAPASGATDAATDKAATDKAFSEAAHVIERHLVINRVYAATMEPRACLAYYDRAEQVRWKMSHIAWDHIHKCPVSEYWLTTITQIARSELTTFDGTRQFMERFGDNADFSQWVALWLYEETKHPHVLMLWLSHLGVACDSQFLIEGRESPKFAAS